MNGAAGVATSLPIIGITQGDPAGIGPEIIVKALSREQVYRECRPLLIGDTAVIGRAIKLTAIGLQFNWIGDIRDARWQPRTIDIYGMVPGKLRPPAFGELSAAAGNAAYESIRIATELALAGKIDAMATAPVNKEALHLAGHKFPGHTEILAYLTKTPSVTMMLAHGTFRVAHVSTHVSMRQACELVTKDRVLAVIRLAHGACRELGIANPRIGVLGLNPHAGESGMFGSEEQGEIQPAITAAKAERIDASGPYPPDTFYPQALAGAFDVCVAMYHDQGHIPVKLAGFRYDGTTKRWTSVSGINVTLGLPIIRTSVDHGTAFDQAGRGTASEESMIEAIDYAAKMAANRLKNAAGSR
jgi:4-hydroxythreonine-4-phosphate dehydrogenase